MEPKVNSLSYHSQVREVEGNSVVMMNGSVISTEYFKHLAGKPVVSLDAVYHVTVDKTNTITAITRYQKS